ncbi:hypothetical protein H0O00_01750 [Candidatus Micrarchaeota archaeon]|nr:hypothetical protein [Candidatus Micrarchaeota archaeon]
MKKLSDGCKLSKVMRQLATSTTSVERRAAFLKASKEIGARAYELLKASRKLLREAKNSLPEKENVC